MTDPRGLAHFDTDDGLTLAYAQEGDGPPLLCLAGLTRNMDDFEPVLTFADRARIIRLDSRGRGRSDHDPDRRNYTVLREAADALALLDHLGIERAAILGTSRGGLIAKTLGVGHLDRISGIVFNDIGPVIEPAGLDYILGYLGKRPGFATHAEAAAALPGLMAPRFVNVPQATWADYARRLWVETPEGLGLRYDPALREAVLEQSSDAALPDLWPLLEAFGAIPIGLIRGANSDLLSADTAARMRQVLPHMLFAEVPGRGHVPFLDEPEAQALISDFLDRLT